MRNPDTLALEITEMLGRSFPSNTSNWLRQLQDDGDGDLLALCLGIDIATHEKLTPLYINLIDDCVVFTPASSPRLAFHQAMSAHKANASDWIGLAKRCGGYGFGGEPEVHAHITAARFVAKFFAYGSDAQEDIERLERFFKKRRGKARMPLQAREHLSGAPSQAVFVADLNDVSELVDAANDKKAAAAAIIDQYGLAYPFDSVRIVYFEYPKCPGSPQFDDIVFAQPTAISRSWYSSTGEWFISASDRKPKGWGKTQNCTGLYEESKRGKKERVHEGLTVPRKAYLAHWIDEVSVPPLDRTCLIEEAWKRYDEARDDWLSRHNNGTI